MSAPQAALIPGTLNNGDPTHITFHNQIASVLTWLAGARHYPTAVQTVNYSPAPGDLALFDATSANLTAALPIAPADVTSISVKMVTTASSHTVTVTAGGSDTFDDGTTSKVLSTAGSVITCLYLASLAKWYITVNLAGGGGMTNPMTTAGDIIVGGAAGVPARLAAGANGLPLILSSGTPAWAAVGLSGGGTGGTTQQGALDSIAGAVTNNQVLAGNGTHVTLRALAAADLPTGTTGAKGALQLQGTASGIAHDGDQAAGAAGLAADSAHVHPEQVWRAADNGLLVWTYQIEAIGGTTQILTAGAVYVVKIPIHEAVSTSTIWLGNSVASSGASTGSFVGLYNSSGTRLVTSADLGALGTGPLSFAVTTQNLTAGTFVWVAMVVNYATTQPTLFKSSATIGMTNLNLTAAASRAGVAATGQTSLPASFTPSSIVTTNNASLFWFGLS